MFHLSDVELLLVTGTLNNLSSLERKKRKLDRKRQNSGSWE